MKETWFSVLDTGKTTLTTSLYKNRIKNKVVQMYRPAKYKDRMTTCVRVIRHFEANAAIEFYQNRLDSKEGNCMQRKSWVRNIETIKKIMEGKDANNNN